MTSYDGRLRVTGRSKLPMGVVVEVSDERMKLLMGNRVLGEWSLDEVSVASAADGFHLELGGESAVLSVVDPGQFANQLGIAHHVNSRPVRSASSNGHGTLTAEVSVSDRLGRVVKTANYDDLEGRLEAIERALRSPEVSPTKAFGHWLALLSELNDRHANGEIPSNIFHRFNTKLIGMMS